ncbi:hypothetical protein ABVK25_002913 [Lepraria finkii]|uniref:Uncharacterized protein n=1 Tax=Lepraria finkii TaxID=1340010 RepID=A0ABR4BF92_9LECA
MLTTSISAPPTEDKSMITAEDLISRNTAPPPGPATSKSAKPNDRAAAGNVTKGSHAPRVPSHPAIVMEGCAKVRTLCHPLLHVALLARQWESKTET